jgi:protein involved in polysaccharide export with SLBB domain
VNFATYQGPWGRFGGILCCTAVLCVLLSGCSDNITLPTEQELADFHAAGPLIPEVDLDRLMATQGQITEYTIGTEDLLEVLMPSMLIQLSTEVTTESTLTSSHMTRVDADGQVTLPIVESLDAQGKTLAELEAAIVAAYWPKYTTRKPSIVVRVAEHKTSQVSITGSVVLPGVYELPAHKMNLVSALMEAGGILDTGAAIIHIHQPGDENQWIRQEKDTLETELLSESRIRLSFQQINPSGLGVINVKDGETLLYAEELNVTDADQRTRVLTHLSLTHPDVPQEYVTLRLCELAQVILPGSGAECNGAQDDALGRMLKKDTPSGPLLLPVKGMNIPFSNIALQDGASISVDGLDPEVFSVMGLVLKPGVVPYPPETDFTLLEALAFAGGVDLCDQEWRPRR